jgi:hypothetical protein
MDDLIERLRSRLADPERRVDTRPRAFDQAVASMDLSSLLSQGSALAGQLGRVVAANQASRPLVADLTATVDGLAAAMATPPAPALRPAATIAMLESAERELGFALPSAIRRVYGEVADGGFGPGSGLLPLATAVATYHEFRVDPPMAPTGQAWPAGLVPLLRYDIGVDAVEASSGRMIAWDPETLTERSGGPGWFRTFSELAPSFEAWLDGWVGSKTPDERAAEAARAAMREHARISREYLAALSPGERAAMGLPETGWEAVVWGGLGLDDDEAP